MKKSKHTFTWRGKRTGIARPAVDRKFDKLRDQLNADAHTKRPRPQSLPNADELLRGKSKP